jgi:hypothetical protein
VDLSATIRRLEIEKQSIELALADLKRLQNGNYDGSGVAPNCRKSNRGRKSMESAERLQVSERMKKYWASRREAPNQRLPAIFSSLADRPNSPGG